MNRRDFHKATLGMAAAAIVPGGVLASDAKQIPKSGILDYVSEYSIRNWKKTDTPQCYTQSAIIEAWVKDQYKGNQDVLARILEHLEHDVICPPFDGADRLVTERFFTHSFARVTFNDLKIKSPWRKTACES